MIALPSYADPTTPTPTPTPNAAAPFIEEGEDDAEVRAWLAALPLFTIRKEPAPLLGKGGRSTAEAVALSLALVPAPTSEAKGRWRAAARAIRDVVKAANDVQLALMDPATVRHRRERPGYVADLYGWEGGGGRES